MWGLSLHVFNFMEATAFLSTLLPVGYATYHLKLPKVYSNQLLHLCHVFELNEFFPKFMTLNTSKTATQRESCFEVSKRGG